MQMCTKSIIWGLLFLLTACSGENQSKKPTTITVQATHQSNLLFYSGIIQPLTSVVIPCPVDGVVMDMPFQYGEFVEKDQLLFLLSSTKFLSDYKNALLQYIKAKSDLNTSEVQLSEAEFLHKNLLISDDDYKNRKANYYSNRLALLQSKDALENLTQKLAVKNMDFDKLTIMDFDKIIQAMHLQINAEHLRILSPVSGMVLFANKNEEESRKISKGDSIKQGDILAIIGDMHGASVRVKVNELIVNQLKPGQKVTVTGIAFPDEKLIGEIRRIDKQGEGANTGLPSFAVEVSIPKLTPAQQKIIHVGMSAKVEINLESAESIYIPIQAVFEKQHNTFVRIYNKKLKIIRDVAVKTGATNLDSVAITVGLHMGDELVLTR